MASHTQCDQRSYVETRLLLNKFEGKMSTIRRKIHFSLLMDIELMKIVISENAFKTPDWEGIVLLLDCGDIAARTVRGRTMRLLKMHKQEDAASLRK